jgi:hypothetical protein
LPEIRGGFASVPARHQTRTFPRSLRNRTARGECSAGSPRARSKSGFAPQRSGGSRVSLDLLDVEPNLRSLFDDKLPDL